MAKQRVDHQSFEGRTSSFSRDAEQTSRATRSVSAINRLSGEARRDALRAHFDAFPPAILSVRSRS